MVRRWSSGDAIAVSSAAALGVTIHRIPLGRRQRGHNRRSEQRPWLPCRKDAYPLNLYLFISLLL